MRLVEQKLCLNDHASFSNYVSIKDEIFQFWLISMDIKGQILTFLIKPEHIINKNWI
jgi:hypothetical protein